MNDCGCISCEIESQASAFWGQVRKARVEHTCSECGETIVVCQQYEYARGIWDNSPATFKTCLPCCEIRESLFCDGFLYGDIWEAVAQHVHDLGGEFPSSCLAEMSPQAREKMCDVIEQYWEDHFDGDDNGEDNDA